MLFFFFSKCSIVSQICKETKDILVEVTSTVSLEMCKKVMEETLMGSLLMGIGTGEEGESLVRFFMPGTTFTFNKI